MKVCLTVWLKPMHGHGQSNFMCMQCLGWIMSPTDNMGSMHRQPWHPSLPSQTSNIKISTTIFKNLYFSQYNACTPQFTRLERAVLSPSVASKSSTTHSLGMPQDLRKSSVCLNGQLPMYISYAAFSCLAQKRCHWLSWSRRILWIKSDCFSFFILGYRYAQ